MFESGLTAATSETRLGVSLAAAESLHQPLLQNLSYEAQQTLGIAQELSPTRQRRSTHETYGVRRLRWVPVARNRLRKLYNSAVSVAVTPTAARFERMGIMSADSFSSLENLGLLLEGTSTSEDLKKRPASPDGKEAEEGLSVMQVTIMIANVLVGAGLLGLPFAFRLAGGAVGAALIVCSTAITALTARMIIWSFEDLGFASDKLSYNALAEAVGGAAGSLGLQVVILIECYGAVVCFIILHATNWPTVLALPPMLAFDLGRKHLELPSKVATTLPLCCAAFVSTLIRPRHLAYVSSVGILATAALVAAVIAAPALDDQHGHEGDACPPLYQERGPALSAPGADDAGPTMSHHLFIPEGAGAALGVILFCFSGHATFPDLYAQMKPSERPRFGVAVNIGFCFAGAFYLTFATLGYLAYGSCAADALTLNLMDSSSLFGRVATIAVLTSTFTIIPIQSLICVKSVETVSMTVCTLLPRACAQVSTRPEAQSMPPELPDADPQLMDILAREADIDMDIEATQPPNRTLATASAPTIFIRLTAERVISRAVLIAVAGLLAISIPNFGLCLALIGSVTTMLISLILPALLWAAAQLILPAGLSVGQGTLSVFLVLLGVLGMLVGIDGSMKIS